VVLVVVDLLISFVVVRPYRLDLGTYYSLILGLFLIAESPFDESFDF